MGARPVRRAAIRTLERIKQQCNLLEEWRKMRRQARIEERMDQLVELVIRSLQQHPDQPPPLADTHIFYEYCLFFEEKELKPGEESPECVICRELYEDNDLIINLHCSSPTMHTYHLNCIRQWASEMHANCPLCRKELKFVAM